MKELEKTIQMRDDAFTSFIESVLTRKSSHVVNPKLLNDYVESEKQLAEVSCKESFTDLHKKPVLSDQKFTEHVCLCHNLIIAL